MVYGVQPHKNCENMGFRKNMVLGHLEKNSVVEEQGARNELGLNKTDNSGMHQKMQQVVDRRK